MLNVTVFIVATDHQGNVSKYHSIDGTSYPDLQELSKAVSAKHTDLARNYPEPEYSIHVGVADSLPNFLRSFREITRAHKVVSA